MNKNSKILVTGANGVVGKSLVEELAQQGFNQLILVDKDNLDLTIREKVFHFFKENKIDYVFHVAAKVGGIKNNLENPVEYFRDNLLINTNVIDACFEEKIKKLIVLNSATIYPKNKKSPNEEDFFSNKLEEENEAYGLSKICAIKLCEYYNKQYETNFINLVSTNIYGKNSSFDPEKTNLVPALISKFHEAKINNQKQVTVWGTGNAIRELIYAKDLAKLLILSMQKINKNDCVNGLLNCGLNDKHSIREIALEIKKIVGFNGEIKFDHTKPEGIKKRTIDSSKFNELIKLKKRTPLSEGLREVYEGYLKII